MNNRKRVYQINDFRLDGIDYIAIFPAWINTQVSIEPTMPDNWAGVIPLDHEDCSMMARAGSNSHNSSKYFVNLSMTLGWVEFSIISPRVVFFHRGSNMHWTFSVYLCLENGKNYLI